MHFVANKDYYNTVAHSLSSLSC